MSKEFYGLATITLENAHIRIDALAHAGPRLVRAMVHGLVDNQFAELPGLKVETPLGEYAMQGGHRLWHAPEAIPRTYVPDHRGLEARLTDGKLLLLGTVEPFSQIQKAIAVQLLEDRPGIAICQTLTNKGAWPIELACWSITQVPLGGVAVLPQPTYVESLLPNRALVLWPYTRWHDPRLALHDDHILVKGEAEVPPLKIGYANNSGWIGYLRNGCFFLKRLDPSARPPYPDQSCNSEIYVNHLFLELETLGSLVCLQPDQSISLSETWEFFPGLHHIPLSIKGIRTMVDELARDGFLPQR